MNTYRLLTGDVSASLASLPAQCIQTCVTSPPYWGLRDYGMAGQLGLEATPEAYVLAMVDVFREVRRVLKDDGTLWLNLGDSYTSIGRSGRKESPGVGATQEMKAVDREVTWAVRDEGDPDAHFKWTLPGGQKPKDLVGIPWMVAFALRQQWERHVVKAATDRAWLAGLVDGEGCVSVVAVKPTTGINESHSMRLQIRMADTEAVDRVVEITGLSNVTHDLNTGPNSRPAQQWKISGDKAADVIADIYPFLTVKRKQAVIGWNIQRLKDGVTTKRGVPIPEANMAQRRLLHDVLRKLNQREPVDIPSWCEEPTVETVPGWYLRSDVIWSKPNPMPESVTDRPTKAHEYMFLLSKSARYYYDAAAIREPYAPSTVREFQEEYTGQGTKDYKSAGVQNPSDLKRRMVDKQRGHGRRHAGFNDRWDNMERAEIANGANKRSVWNVATHPYAGAHFATFPEKLIEPCILAGSRIGDTVLDPFTGSGTTGAVSIRHQRDFIGCELNPEYVTLAERRIASVAPLFSKATA